MTSSGSAGPRSGGAPRSQNSTGELVTALTDDVRPAPVRAVEGLRDDVREARAETDARHG
jgi:hypothetical protein